MTKNLFHKENTDLVYFYDKKLFFLALNKFHQILFVFWYHQKLLSDVAGGLIFFSDNPLDSQPIILLLLVGVLKYLKYLKY